MKTLPSTGSLRQQTKAEAKRRSAIAMPVETQPLTAIKVEMANGVGETLSPAPRKIRWRWGVLAAVAMALLSLYPQIDLWLTRGADWQGAFVSPCYDEEVYGAYINALILGRPRRTEPLEVPEPSKPSYESLFSIQFVPSYLITLPARALGLTANQAFIVLLPLMAFLATLMLFYLLAVVTRDEAWAAVGALAVLVFGALAARNSVLMHWLGKTQWFGTFLFLRRYMPAAVFPIFFGFIALIWHAFTRPDRQAWRAAIAAGLVFFVLVFSYFYLWTAAAAWLACFVLAWLVARRTEWATLVKRLAPTALCGAVALAIYAYMLAHRTPAIDKAQALTLTHAPDFYRAPQLIGALTLLLLCWGIKKGRAAWREPSVLLITSLALAPFAVFNQQIITGHSLQPIHYELFIINYVSVLALVLMPTIFRRGQSTHFPRRMPKFLLTGLACVVLGWGVVEIHGSTAEHKSRNLGRDHFMPVAKRLAALAAEHGQGAQDREVVFSPDMLVVSDNIAALTPQVPFWATHAPFGAGLSSEEQQERYFQFLYYSGVKPGALGQDLATNKFTSIGSLFGYERFVSELTTDAKPITSDEIREKVAQYSAYVAAFDREHAHRPALSYIITHPQAPIDFSNLDQWYIRDQGEKIGLFTLYQVKLR